MSLPSLAEKWNDQIVKILNLLVTEAFKELMTLFTGQVVVDCKLRRRRTDDIGCARAKQHGAFD